MSMFTLAISCLTTSNLPWFMNLTLQVPMILFFTGSNFTSITSHIHSWALFSLWVHPFILSGVISPLFSSSILGTNQPGEFIFQCQSFCLFILLMVFSRQEYWPGLPFLFQCTTFCQNSPLWPVHLGWLYMALLVVSFSLTKLWSMRSVWLVFCDCGFHSVCPLMDKDKWLMEASSRCFKQRSWTSNWYSLPQGTLVWGWSVHLAPMSMLTQ